MNNTYLSSKSRYEILDGLRGVAALMVLLFHCLETYSWKWGVQIIDHGYLMNIGFIDFRFPDFLISPLQYLLGVAPVSTSA